MTRVVIVTGASRGLGKAISEILVKEFQVNVVVNGRSTAALSSLAESLNAIRAESCVVAEGDVSHHQVAQAVVEKAISSFGRLDAVINNAGVLEPLGKVADVDPDGWATLIQVNLMGCFHLSKYAIPHLRKTSGRLVHVSSGVSVNPMMGASAYSASKAALNMLSSVIAMEEPELVSVAVRPGVVDTYMQTVTRGEAGKELHPATQKRFQDMKANGEMLLPEVPGRALAKLSLAATKDLSGQYFSWDDERVKNLSV